MDLQISSLKKAKLDGHAGEEETSMMYFILKNNPAYFFWNSSSPFMAELKKRPPSVSS